MNRLFIFCFLLLSFHGIAQVKPAAPVFNTDSFKAQGYTYYFTKNWRFHSGDDPAMALPAYDDSKWSVIKNMETGSYNDTFSSIGWFRYHFSVDSGIAAMSLALEMTQFGASEVFFDGVKIDSFGKIAGENNSEYYDPQNIPFLLPPMKAGEHLIAVRYANYAAQHNYNLFNSEFRHFKMRFGEANLRIEGDRSQTSLNGIIFILLFGLFLSFGMSNFFLYLYYRISTSNLYFSIFCATMAIGFIIAYINRTTNSPQLQLVNGYITKSVIVVTCFALSGISNQLFGKNRKRFLFIGILCIVSFALWFVNTLTADISYLILIFTVLLEAIILTTRAMYRRVPGAKILGVGILFFAGFLFICLLFSFNGLNFDEGSVLGEIFLVITALAILSIPISLSLYLAWSNASVNKNLQNQLEQVHLLNEHALEQEQEKKRILESQNELLEQEVKVRTAEIVAQKEKIERQHDELKIEKKKTDDLLLNILPEEIAEELKEKGFSEARAFSDVTVLFTDFVDFTKAGEAMSPAALVDELHACFKAFDEIIATHGIEKIKTIGDAYLCVCGLPLPASDHAQRVVKAAQEINIFMAARKRQLLEKTFGIRIGINSGSVVAGIVGVKKFAYDIWGDTVNTAARMEQNSEAGKINISQSTYELVKNDFVCTYRGEIAAKNKGKLSMYFVDGGDRQ